MYHSEAVSFDETSFSHHATAGPSHIIFSEENIFSAISDLVIIS